MVEVSREEPLAVVRVGRRSKSWLPSLSYCLRRSAVGRQLGCVSVGGAEVGLRESFIAGSQRRWFKSQSSSRPLLAHSLDLTAHLSLTLQGVWASQGRSVSVGSAGMSHSETLETLSRGRAGWAWCFDRAGLPLPLFCGAGVTGANGSQCTYGECTQEQAARPAACEGTTAGAQRCGWVTAWPVVSGQMEVVSMMRLDGAPLEIERQRPRAVQMLSPFLQREPRLSLSVRTTVWRRPRWPPASSRLQTLAGRLVR